MPDPLNVAASIIGVTIPALHGTQLLLDNLNKIIDTPQVVQSLKDDVIWAEMALQSLQAIKDPKWEVLGEMISD